MRKMNCQHRNFTIKQTAEQRKIQIHNRQETQGKNNTIRNKQRKKISQKENFSPTKQGIHRKAKVYQKREIFHAKIHNSNTDEPRLRLESKQLYQNLPENENWYTFELRESYQI